MTRAEEKEKRRDEIIEKSIELFVRRGYYGTKISDIANEVGMSTGLLFHYFPSKEKLYEEIIKFGLDGTKSVMTFNKEKPIEFFTDAAKTILDSVKIFPFSAKMFSLIMQAVTNDFVSDETKNLLSQIDNISQSVEVIKLGQSQGVIKQGNPLALSVVFWSAISGVMQQIAVYPDIPIPNAEWFVDILRA